MKSILLKMPDELLSTTDECAEALELSRAEYIRHTIERTNNHTRAIARRNRLAAVSRRVRKESMRVNAECEVLDLLDD